MVDNDYIRRKAAIDIALDWCPDDDGSVVKTGDLRGMLDELEAIPAADVRPVVLCQDCKYCLTVDEYERWCNGFCSPARLVCADDYCSRGERRNER